MSLIELIEYCRSQGMTMDTIARACKATLKPEEIALLIERLRV